MSDSRGDSASAEPAEQSPIIDRAFGEANRRRLLDIWFRDHGDPTPKNASEHVYRLLLWIDRTTGLAHCYESDKSQPGRPWYARSLIFHGWTAEALGTSAAELPSKIDWLFSRATEDLAAEVARRQERAATAAVEQRRPYDGRGFPEPGEDPELAAIITEVLGTHFSAPVPDATWRILADRIHAHVTKENKRRNLVGEGFEDVLREIVARVHRSSIAAETRVAIGDIEGFNAAGRREKVKKVDLYVRNQRTHLRTLVTAKWSIRADREEQFASDFEAYARLERDGESFDYVLVTNEFDAARLLAACERRAGNQPLFRQVVHVRPDAVLAVYGDEPQRSAEAVARYIDSGRLISVEQWLTGLGAA